MMHMYVCLFTVSPTLGPAVSTKSDALGVNLLSVSTPDSGLKATLSMWLLLYRSFSAPSLVTYHL